MSRGIGVVDALTSSLPEWAVVVLGLLTQLGDAWFVAVLLPFLYWRAPREREGVATAAGGTVAAIGCYQTLKYLLRFPRPEQIPAERSTLEGAEVVLYDATATATGYGFPSGHATTATALYVGLAAALTIATPGRRFVGAAVLAVTVSFTRLALGVHYLVDVVAGAGLGVALVAAHHLLAARLPYDRPTVGFGMAVPFGVTFVLASGGRPEAVVLLVVSVLALVGWRRFGPEQRATVAGST